MIRRGLTLVLCISAMLLAMNALAQAQMTIFDPALTFRTLETPHFRIVFHQGLENIAHEAATVAEESYEIIRKEFGKTPNGNIYIVISDYIDAIQGSATPIPQNTIRIGTTQGRLADWANVRLDSWIRVVVYHELLHIMDLDFAGEGLNSLLRMIFGRVALPNIEKPISFIEGLAVYEKYKHLGESRLNDANTIMMVRQMVLDNKIPRFDEISGYYTRSYWPPGGLLAYNFGSWLLRYIEETYGSDSMKKFNNLNSSSLLNLLFIVGFGDNFNNILKKTLGKSADDVYSGFKYWLYQRFSSEIQAITQEGLTSSVRLTRLGWESSQPSWSRDGKQIIYSHNGPERNGVRLMNAEGQEDREVVFGSMQLPSFSPDGKNVLYTKLDFDGPYYAHSDIYLYDLQKKAEKRLTRGTRAYVAAFAPDGQTIYFGHQIARDASTGISSFDLRTGKIRVIKEFADNSITVHSIAVSPDGKKLALSLWKRGGYQDIYLLAAEGGTPQPITQDKDEDLDPDFSPDGQYILFSSDRGEQRIANLFAYKLSDGSFHRITNVLTSALDPAISPDGHKIAFTSYGSDGYDIHLMPFEPTNWKPVAISRESIPTWSGFSKTNYSIKPYDPIPSLMPKLWLPIGDEHSVGIATLGQDVLGRHVYQIATSWDFELKKPSYFFDYQFAQILPIISLSLSDSRDGSSQEIGLRMPLALSYSEEQLLDVRYSHSRHLAEDSRHTAPWTEDVYAAQYSYQGVHGSDLWRDTLSISVQGQLENPSDDKARRRVTMTLGEVFRFPFAETHALTLKLAGGWSDVERAEDGFSIGGDSSEFALRAFAEETQQGKQALISGLGYEFPLVSIERWIAYWPVLLDDVRGSLFVEAGLAGDVLDINDLKIGFGVEMILSLTTGYLLNWAFRAGIAQGVGEPSPRFYLSVGL